MVIRENGFLIGEIEISPSKGQIEYEIKMIAEEVEKIGIRDIEHNGEWLGEIKTIEKR